MPERGGFLSGYAGNPFQRVGRWAVNKLLPGEQRASDGTLNNKAVMLGVAGMPLRLAAGLYGGPMGGLAAGKLIGRGVDHFSGNGEDAGIGPLTMQQFSPYVGTSVSNVGMAAGVNPQVPTMPAVNTQAPWSPMSPFAPGSGLAFAGMPQGRPIGGNLGFGGGQQGYNNGAGAGTGFGAYNVMNDAWGEAARGFGVGGMSGGTRDMAMQNGPKFHIK